MKNEACERYLEDPEGNAAHLRECATCRAFFAELDAPVEHAPLVMESLPLAAWEGASHRSWPLVVGGLLALLAIVIGVFMAIGTSPIDGLRAAFTSSVPPADVLGSLFRHAPGAVRNAPAVWQIAIGILFIVVNTIFILLLRRAPKGIDV